MILYRVVSQAELDDLRACGRCRLLEGGMERKWFAERLADARAWRELFSDDVPPPVAIVGVEPDDHALSVMVRVPRQDAVGPGWYVGPRNVHRIRFVRVIE